MWNPFRTQAKRDGDIDEIDEIEPPPMSYFIINKYAASVAVIFFVIGWYCAYHYHNPQPPDRELPEMNEAAIDKLLDKPCQDIVVKADKRIHARCNDPRMRATVQGAGTESFIVCSCTDSVH